MVYRFGRFELDEETGELRSDGVAVAIQPKPLALLRLLLRERHRVVSQEELLDALWPGVAVTPSSLTRAVSHARRAIGDTHRGERIRSQSRLGYRFTGPVLELGAAEPAGASGSGSPGPGTSADDRGAPFIGRADVLRRLRDAFARALRGEPAVAIVSGPPGIGKTRLVEVFANEAERRGALVVVGRCRDGDGVPAFWLWAQILRGLLADSAASVQVRELAAHSGELAGLVPELAMGVPESARDARSVEQSRFLFFDAVSRAIVRSSSGRALILVLEDIQWAGPASLRLLEHLALDMGAASLLVVATVRDASRERGDPLLRTLDVLRRQESTVDIPLRGLSRAEVSGLLEWVLGQPSPADLTSELFARTEGVPLFLREAIRWLEERGDLERPDRIPRQGLMLPGRSLDLIRRALEALPDACAELVGAASVLGREFSLPLVASVAEVTRDQALDLLDRVVGAGIVEVEPDDPGRYRFVHALFREAAYDGLSAGVRARLHRRTALRLEEQHAGEHDRVLSELAHHHHRSIAVGDAEHLYRIAMRAAERASQLLAFEQAASHYAQALDALAHADRIDAGRRLATLLAYGEACHHAGDRTLRRELLTEAMQTARDLQRPLDFARAAIGFCDLSEWAPRDDTARGVVNEALALLDPNERLLRARLETRAAYGAARTSGSEAEAAARRALSSARLAGDPEALEEALYTLHFIIAGPFHLEERAQLVNELASSVTSRREIAVIGLVDLACDRIALGDALGARRLRGEAASMAGPEPHPGMLWHLRVYDTGLALLEGRLDDAERIAREAFDFGRRVEHPYAKGCNRLHRGELARLRGDEMEVLRQFSPIALAAEPVQWIRAMLGRAKLALGQGAEARALFEELAASDFRDVPQSIRWTRSLVEISLLCAELGDEKRAPMLEEMLSDVADHHGVLPVPICYAGPVSRCRAGLRAVQGRSAEAVDLYDEAAAACETLGARPMLATVWLEQGRLLTRIGRRRPGAERLASAARLAEELGLEGVVRGVQGSRG